MSTDRLHYALWKLTLKAPGRCGPDEHPVVSQMVLGRGPDGGRVRIAAWAAAAVLVVGTAATACGDDSGGGGDEAPPKPPAESTTSAPAEPTSDPAPDPTADQTSDQASESGAPADKAAAEKEVKENWVKFFDPEVGLREKEAVLENGPKMRAVLQSFSGDERGRQVTAKAGKVRFTSATEAEVTYSLALKGSTVLPTAKGTSVEQDGTWKVSVKTLCALVQLSGNASPGPGC